MKRLPSSPTRSDPRASGLGRLRASVVAGSVALVTVATSSCQSSPSAHPGGAASAATAHTAEPPHPALLLQYLAITTGGAAPDAKLPLVIALHGLGGRPENFLTLFEEFPTRARIVAPHSKTKYGDGFEWFAPYGAISDESAPALGKAADEVAVFAEQAAARFPTLGKPIVTGFSQGGALSFAVAVRHPASIGASLPISGWLPPPLWPSDLPKDAPPIIAFHGTADQRVPLERDQSAVTALAKLGFHAELQVNEGVEHAIPPQVRDQVYAALTTACDDQRKKGPHP